MATNSNFNDNRETNIIKEIEKETWGCEMHLIAAIIFLSLSVLVFTVGITINWLYWETDLFEGGN